ncbi:minor tail protein [Mycobacterium phage Rope]|uniref:Uncharacterized protein n=8 Tax=Papyrusvirus TaxID=1982554 RepID=A0A0Y0AD89_9CAUD|nr:minor tail protein [Mycobacterium phage Papyrus]YP_009614253.1 minor tail protein [Mycobacterium phage Send513]AMB17242.1 hypothetical protein SEA_WEISS13_28 [Mycobacterium phage Weiss13]ARW57114.1 hypothetical protein SEA_ZENON_29 [Mycobacterium phage Zenon]AVO21427.1 minor tail protein [Mycobacterium phage Nilo]AYQ98602.1 minor tail protein [Mycobacterium phage Riparian]QCG78135.1 minor tail protein [Mycobacterium phage Candle]QNN99688.1 minor tail protein [Mycobacterium phage Rope]
MPSKNLEPGQFQIGNLVMGYYTMYSIERFDIGNYDVNVQDSQAQASNFIRFGQDTLKPAPVQLTINFRKNRQMANVSALLKDPVVLNFDNDPGLGDLQREWRAEDVMLEWGATKPLYFCGSDGITRMFFGRPGKLAYQLQRVVDSLYYQCQAEFRRLDTFAYSETEWYHRFELNEPETLTLTRGNAPSWVRFLIQGPAKHPIINFGYHQLELDYDIPEGEIVEISSYPWSRRAVTSAGNSVAAYLIGEDPYLEHVRFNDHEAKEISWNATDTNENTSMVLLWHDAYQILE